MTVPKLYLDSTEINFTIRNSYSFDLNPKNGTREWHAEIYAGENNFKPSQYGALMPMLTGSTHIFRDEDGVNHTVNIKDPHVENPLTNRQTISLTLSEVGFDDSSDSDADIPISGYFGDYQFEGKLGDFSDSTALFGAAETTLSGATVKSRYFGERKTITLKMP